MLQENSQYFRSRDSVIKNLLSFSCTRLRRQRSTRDYFTRENEPRTKYFSRTLRYGEPDGTKNLVSRVLSLEEKTKPSLPKPKAFKEQNVSVFVLFDMDKSLNYVFISVKHDSWSLKGDLIKFQARNIMRENFNFSHETREEDVPVRGLCSSCLVLERISRTSFHRSPDHPRFSSRCLDIKFNGRRDR